jgi:hypothetical protein
MTTLVSTAVTAIVAALQSAPAVAPNVARVRLRPQAQATTQAVVVRPLQSQAGEASLGPGYPVSWVSTVSVECYARSTAATTPDVAVDALVESVYARLMADTTLGGAVISLQPQDVSYDFDADGEQTTCVTLVFQILQRATAGTLS